MYWTECYMLVKNDSYEYFEAAMGTTSGRTTSEKWRYTNKMTKSQTTNGQILGRNI